jgi:hypothetical protein
MATQTCDLARCVAGYAGRMQAAIGDGHHVASPLGAWLLLALAGPATTGAERAALSGILGCDVDQAARAAADLLTDPHPAVAGAAAVWTAPSVSPGEAIEHWQAGLPAAVTRGDLPDQAGLDRWARDHTFGLIEEFPVSWSPDLYLVLATALATKVSWLVPFDLAPAAELGARSEWAGRVSQVLRTPKSRPGQPAGHRQFIAVTASAGDVAVHIADARDGLIVCSVAADPAVPPGDVVAVAHEIGCAAAIGAPVRQRSLADLPLGEGPAWLLREERSNAADACTAVLPAWRARSDHDLTSHADLGFWAVKQALAPDDPWQARQAAMARYSRLGFEAAAVTAVAVELAMIRPSGVRRVADLRFAHPYAVVALATDGNESAPPAQDRRNGWHGVPVFSAWVTEPSEASDDSGSGPRRTSHCERGPGSARGDPPLVFGYAQRRRHD